MNAVLGPTHSSTQEKDEICYGAVSEAIFPTKQYTRAYLLVKLFDVRAACPAGFGFDMGFYRSRLRRQQTKEKFEVRSRDSYFCLLSHQTKEFALLDVQATRFLTLLQDAGQVRFEAVILPLPDDTYFLQQGKQVTNEIRNTHVSISVNIHGPHNVAAQIGARLTLSDRYLQHPVLLDYGMEYTNPQYYLIPDSSTKCHQFVKDRLYGVKFAQHISSEVTKLLDSLDTVDTEIETPPLTAIKTPLLKSVSLNYRYLSEACADT